jgi:hypothetical protein
VRTKRKSKACRLERGEGGRAPGGVPEVLGGVEMSDEVRKETAVTMVCLYESFASTSSGDRRPKCCVSDDLPTAFPGRPRSLRMEKKW